MTFNIREANPTDSSLIADFSNRLAEETESRSLVPQLIEPGVAAFLADPSKGRYWLAEEDSRVIGQIAVTYEWSDWRNGMLWWIQSVYIDADCRRRGVYSSLYRHVETLAKADSSVVGLRLYVEKDNKRAQAAYEKHGMDMTSYQIMQTIFRRTDQKVRHP